MGMEGRKKVVIIEDNEVFAALMSAALEEEFDVVVGGNGLQGISLCLEGGISAVVTDIGMPDMDGLSMLQQFQRHPALSSLPVVVVTATHFNRISREEVSKFPQVQRLLSKMENIERLADEVRAVIAKAESGPPGRP